MKHLIVCILFLVTATGVFAQGRQAPPVPPEQHWHETYNMNLFRGVEGTYFDLENDHGATGVQSYVNILDWLRGRIAGLQVYQFRDIKVPFLRNRPASVFVDEVRVDYGFLNALSTADIGLIKVVQAPVGVVNAPGGAIAIYTKRGEAEEESEDGNR